MESLLGFLSVLAIGAIFASWRAILYVSNAYREKEDWYRKRISTMQERYDRQCTCTVELSARNIALEELIDTLHDERAQARRWYAEAPKWMVDSYVKPE